MPLGVGRNVLLAVSGFNLVAALLLVLGFFISTGFAAVPMLHEASRETIPGEFVAVFHANATDERINQHMNDLKDRLVRSQTDSAVLFEYDTALRGYALRDAGGEVVRSHLITLDADLEHIEPNQVYRTTGSSVCVEQREATWGLVRTSQRALAINGLYPHKPTDGRGINAYIVDTGINHDHVEFEGRAVFGYDATGEGPGDTNGHGTHVAGTVMSAQFGVAKAATAVDVKVISGSGAGSTAGVIAGIDWAARDNDGEDGVANLPLGGGISAAMNAAVNNAFRSGLTMIVASGNSNANSCLFSPASAENSFTVDASDNTDRRSTFSNFGTCSDIYAPGTAITSTWIGSAFAVNTISGTSMASPHVAGVAAVLRQQHPQATAKEIYEKLKEHGTEGVIDNHGASPNLLLYRGDDCGTDRAGTR